MLLLYSLGKKIKVCGAVGRAAAEQHQVQDQGEPGEDALCMILQVDVSLLFEDGNSFCF
jgi:hypothetical protein